LIEATKGVRNVTVLNIRRKRSSKRNVKSNRVTIPFIGIIIKIHHFAKCGCIDERYNNVQTKNMTEKFDI